MSDQRLQMYTSMQLIQEYVNGDNWPFNEFIHYVYDNCLWR